MFQTSTLHRSSILEHGPALDLVYCDALLDNVAFHGKSGHDVRRCLYRHAAQVPIILRGGRSCGCTCRDVRRFWIPLGPNEAFGPVEIELMEGSEMLEACPPRLTTCSMAAWAEHASAMMQDRAKIKSNDDRQFLKMTSFSCECRRESSSHSLGGLKQTCLMSDPAAQQLVFQRMWSARSLEE